MIVQQLVGLALEVAVVEHIHQGVLVGLLDDHIAIGCVQALGSGLSTLDLGAVGGLTAAHDTAAGASHDLDEVVFLFTGLDGLQNLTGICQTGSNTDLHIDAVVRNGEFLDENRQPIEEFYKIVNEYEKKLDYLKEHTTLPDEVNMSKVMDLVAEINGMVVNQSR